MQARGPHRPGRLAVARPAGDSVLVAGEPEAVSAALRAFRFVPPLWVEPTTQPYLPAAGEEKVPLLLLLGRCPGLPDTAAITNWLDHLLSLNGPPVALLLPREETGWCALAAHPQCCGLLPIHPAIEAADAERVLAAARRARALRWRREHPPRGRLAWEFSSSDAADVDRIWLLVSLVLADLRGFDEELARLGMAFAEALTNALEHGNLELPSSLKDDGGNMDQFFRERERRLADPRYAPRRIGVELEIDPRQVRIRLHNQGPGFRPPGPDKGRHDAAESAHPYGLGLRMIEGLVDTVTIAPDGRGITLTSALPQSPQRRAA